MLARAACVQRPVCLRPYVARGHACPTLRRYNEVIVDVRSVASQPQAIAGFFMMARARGNAAVRIAHSAFLKRYAVDPATGPPLVMLDLGAEQPFSLAT